jgi:hypothetical protein
MSSESRIASSRANGAKSRGPKTAAGKLRSSQNSRRHGMLSKTVVLENERPAAFSHLLAAFEAELQPANRVEKVCVDTMAVAHWRLMRLWGIQKAGLQSEMRRQIDQKHDNATSTADAFRTLCDQSRVAGLLLRYETGYHRQYARALNLLLTWKNSKRTQETPCEQALNKESEPTENPDRTQTEPTPNPPGTQNATPSVPKRIAETPICRLCQPALASLPKELSTLTSLG